METPRPRTPFAAVRCFIGDDHGDHPNFRPAGQPVAKPKCTAGLESVKFKGLAKVSAVSRAGRSGGGGE